MLTILPNPKLLSRPDTFMSDFVGKIQFFRLACAVAKKQKIEDCRDQRPQFLKLQLRVQLRSHKSTVRFLPIWNLNRLRFGRSISQ